MGYSPRGHKESDTAEQLTHTQRPPAVAAGNLLYWPTAREPGQVSAPYRLPVSLSRNTGLITERGLNGRRWAVPFRIESLIFAALGSATPQLGRASHGWSMPAIGTTWKGRPSSQVPRLGPGCDSTCPRSLLLPAFPAPSPLRRR